MDKETLSNYGWIVICVLVLAVMLAFATPFGTFIADGFKATYTGLFQTGDSALDVGLNAVGVSNKLPCGHGRKEAGDHSQKGCGHYNCQDTDCGCVPASCGVEGHWSGDGLDHTTKVNHTGSQYATPHTYACQCTEGWTVPEGGTYTMYSAINGKRVYNENETLPDCYAPKANDSYTFGDYKYEHDGYNPKGWKVSVIDKSKTTYGPILQNIFNLPVNDASGTFAGCTKLTDSPDIPEGVLSMDHTFSGCTSLQYPAKVPSTVTNMYETFYGCTALLEAPDIKHCANLTYMRGAFMKCSSLVVAPALPDKITNMLQTFFGCSSMTTYIGSTDADGDFSNYKMPSGLKDMQSTFSGCASLVEPPVTPSTVTTMYGTFWDCKKLVSAPIVPNGVTDMTSTFQNCTSLNEVVSIPCQLGITGWANCPATVHYYHVDGCDGSCGK